ncbi:uroporphyrinogen-III C-methyltransferase [Aquifex pyrophilus]
MGKVYLVGAGPGDPELLTLKAYRLIKEADVILYDALVSEGILSLAREDAIKVYVGKRRRNHSLSQEEINELIYRYVLSFPKVVRLKGGDPFIFGRGGEELLYLVRRGIEVEVVPGISSFLGASAYSNIPLTHRGVSSSFAVLSGHEPEKVNWKNYRDVETLVILMGVKRRKDIAKKLLEAGRDPKEPVAFVENATRENQKIFFTRLGEIEEDFPPVNAPAVMLIGNVVKVVKSVIDLNKCTSFTDSV